MERKIQLENVYFSYGDREVLSDVSLVFNQGELVAIKGDNGTGKTTLLKIMSGLLKPTRGKVLSSFKKASFLSQLDFSNSTSFPATVREIVSLGLKDSFFSFMRKEDWKRVDSYLDKFSLLEYKDRSLDELSGGQQQKVRLLKALIDEPDVMFLDECTSGIDKESRKNIMEMIKEESLRRGMLVIFVSHLEEDLSYAERIVTLKEEGE